MRGLVLVLLGWALIAPPATAQVELDGSLGSTSGLVPGGLLPDGSSATYLIEESYGRRSGPNLFHSFSRFSIPASRSAAFTGDPSIERVIGRVTGGSISQIDGALRNTIDGADLYLLNPRGFFFSGSASLDLRGSLYLSSADVLRFEDELDFSTLPSTGEVLSFAAPSAWGFTASTAPATIRFNQARNLGVPRGETLEVVGGPVIVSGFTPTTTLQAPGGTIALASRATPGDVPLDVAKLDARGAEAGELGAVSIGTNAVLDVSDAADLAPSRGRIVIRGGTLTIDSSRLRADSAAEAPGDTPDIDLETSKSILLRRSNPLLRATSIEVGARGSASGGGLRLSSEAITLTGASVAGTSASGAARAGALVVDAGTLALSGASSLASSATGDATAGAVRVGVRTIELSEGAQIRSVNEASGSAPDVEVAAEERIGLVSGALLATQARGGGGGASLRIGAETLEQASGARIESSASGTGAGGDVEIRAASVGLRGASLGADPGGVFASSSGSSTAGAIRITADDLVVEGGAQLSGTALGIGDGGDVEIHAAHEVLLSGSSGAGPSGVFARSGLGPGTSATGDGGEVLVVAPVVRVADGAEISTQTFGAGTAGGIQIVASESVEVAGGASARSSINAKASSGAGGNIAIETGELRVDDGGEISASTLDTGDSGDIDVDAQRVRVGGGAPSGAGPAGVFAQSIPAADSGVDGGDGGDIEIRAASRLEVTNGGVISVKTRGAGAAGSIRVEAPVVDLSDGAEISTQTSGSGTAGGVHIVAEQSVGIAGGAEARSLINAQASVGRGGDIAIETGELRVDDGGLISASALDTGDSGGIEIEAERVYVGGGASSAAGPAGILAQSLATSDSGIAGGHGGDIEIRAASLLALRNAGAISVETLGKGDAGAIAIRGAQTVSLENAAISARSAGSGAAGSVTLDGVGELLVGAGGSVTTETLSSGLGGSIAIDAERQVLLHDGGEISALSQGVGDAGNIAIDAGLHFTARDGGRVTTAAAAADGGDIAIAAGQLVYLLEGRLESKVEGGDGNGGNITVDPEFVVLNRAEVRASAVGDGGNITIQTDHYVRDASSVVDASSQLGIDGEILISSPAVDLSSELAQLDASFLDASSKLAPACAARAGESGTFAVHGRARPASPEAPLGAPSEAERERGCAEPNP